MVRFYSFAMAMLANLATSVAGPIDTEAYRELTNGFGQTGACRGNGGGDDRVDSRYTIMSSQAECERVCDSDIGCVAYSYNDATSDCVIYGPGQDGSCSLAIDTGASDTRYHNFNSCGVCTQNEVGVEGVFVEALCGICSKQIPDSLPNSEGICSTFQGLWNPATWTSGTWENPESPWTGQSYTHSTLLGSTNVHTVSVASGFHCYDKVHNDGQPTCNGSIDGNSCQISFEDLRTSKDCVEGCTFYPRNGSHSPHCDGISADGETSCIKAFEEAASFGEASCVSIGTDCAYVPAPVFIPAPAALHAPPVDLGPGWQPEVMKATAASGDCKGSSLAQCEGKDDVAGFEYGVCRIDNEKPNGENANQKYCANCVNTNDDQVNLSEQACAQACLDEPSGGCVAFSHKDGANCLIYGIGVDQHVRNPGDVDHEWGGWTYHFEACIAPKFPIACRSIDTIKPNGGFICRHLNTDNSRWLAWGEAAGSETIAVELTVIPILSDPVGVEDFTQEMKDNLRTKMATIAFVDADKDVDVQISEGDQDGHVKVSFAIQAPSTAVIPMTGMLETVLVSKSRDGMHYFHSILTSSNGNKNSGTMIPRVGHIAGILVSGMRHNLVDKSKEPFTSSWSELSQVVCDHASPTASPAVIVTAPEPALPPPTASPAVIVTAPEPSLPPQKVDESDIGSDETIVPGTGDDASSGELHSAPVRGITLAVLMYSYIQM